MGTLEDFGVVLSLCGDTVLVGAPRGRQDVNGTLIRSGVGWIFQRTGFANWTVVTQLAPPGAQANDFVGSRVALYEDIAVLGAPSFEGPVVDSGVAFFYTFVSGSWQFLAMRQPPNPANGMDYGECVAASQNWVLVCAPLEIVGGLNQAGACYLYGRDTGGPNAWELFQNITLAAPMSSDRLGSGCAIDEPRNLLLLGSRRSIDDAHAFVFQFDGSSWNEFATFQSVGGDSDQVTDVDLFNGTAVLGVPLDGPGRAYLFQQQPGSPTQWNQTKFLEGTTVGDNFGDAVDLSGDRILAVGAPGFDSSTGAAQLFVREYGGPDNWGPGSPMLMGGGPLNQFGTDVAIDFETFMIGEPAVSPGFVRVRATTTDACVEASACNVTQLGT